MLLTVSKRLEFSASRRLYMSRWSDAKNLAIFGPETSARRGTGRNYVAYFVFTGPVDPSNGMLINISEIKERSGKILPDSSTSMLRRCSPMSTQSSPLVMLRNRLSEAPPSTQMALAKRTIGSNFRLRAKRCRPI